MHYTLLCDMEDAFTHYVSTGLLDDEISLIDKYCKETGVSSLNVIEIYQHATQLKHKGYK